MRYRIWSFEHDAWWAPNERGYCANKLDAGQYEVQRAAEIVEGARGEEIALAVSGTGTEDEPTAIVFSATSVASYLEVLS